ANNLAEKVLLKGKLLPEELEAVTTRCYIGVNLVEDLGLNQYYSLANKFFDYMHAGIPQVTMNFPEYKAINDEFEIAVLVDELTAGKISDALNALLNDEVLYKKLQSNCIRARLKYNWQLEEKKLIEFYAKIVCP
ncbi:MAG TPA: hypothetical protein VKH37_04400, partial [Ferruginibacter sp.]|nr:hypothetical protein [Ferruginibacter sp.]